jgi:hypothetical protein
VAYLALGLLVLLLLLLLLRAFVAADPGKLARGLKWSAAGLGLAGAAFLLFTGRLGPVFAVGAGFAPFLRRLRGLFTQPGAASPSSGDSSEVETEWLRMRLDHDTGEMSGVVRRGAFQGRRLEELAPDDLLALWRECGAEDEASVRLLEAYLDRLHPDWRETAAAGPDRRSAGARGSGVMTREEAYEVLGLRPGAQPPEIRAAHHRLMLKLHPDQGGSDWLAARINQARDVLLKG